MKTYIVSGLVLDVFDNPRRFICQVTAASIKKAVREARSKLQLRCGDLVRDISVSEVTSH